MLAATLAVAAPLGVRLNGTAYTPAPWDADHLQFAVRVPFPSRASQATQVFGRADATTPLKLHSLLPEHGVIFSDGILTDFLDFNSGSVAEIGVAKEVGRVVV